VIEFLLRVHREALVAVALDSPPVAVLDRALEAPDRLLVMERVGPHQSAVEPRLGHRRSRRRRAPIGAEIEVGLRHRQN